MTPTPSDAQPVAPTKPRCAKPGCGALRIVGHPCTDWDCPQQYVSAADYRAVESALDAERQKRETAEWAVFDVRNRWAADREGFLEIESNLTQHVETAERERDEALLVAGAAEDHVNEWRHHCKTAEASLAKANARIAELEAGWQPIETAPRDGTPVLVTVLLRDKSEAVVGEAHFEDRGDRDADTGWWWAGESPGDEYAEQIGSWHFPPSFWRPLPVPGNITNIEKERDDGV